MAKRQRQRVQRQPDDKTQKIVRKTSTAEKNTNRTEPALLKNSPLTLGSREIMRLQQQYGNNAVQAMLVQRAQDGDKSNPPIRDSQLTLQTTPPDMALALHKMMHDVFSLAEALDMEDLSFEVQGLTIMARDFEAMRDAYQEAINLQLVGSLLTGQALPTDATAPGSGPFGRLDQRVATFLMQPSILISVMQRFAIQLGQMLIKSFGADGTMQADHEAVAAIKQLEEQQAPFYETVAEGEKAVLDSQKALMMLAKLKRQQKR